MKYKVVYEINSSGGGNPDGMCMSSFYTKQQAINSAQLWAEIEPGYYTARLWDGVQWTTYTIVP